MKRLFLAAALVAAGCSNGAGKPGNGGGNGGVVLREWPSSADWEVATPGHRYGDESLDWNVGEARAAGLRANGFDTLLKNQYRPWNWYFADREHKVKKSDLKPPEKIDERRLTVEIYIHQNALGAGRTFQAWNEGQSINDVGERAYLAAGEIVFLRGPALVRLFATGPWKAREAGKPALEVAKAVDAWLQGK